MNNTLKQCLLNNFEKKRLSPKQLQQLLDMKQKSTNFSATSKTDIQSKMVLKHMYGIAVASLICIVSVFVIYDNAIPVKQRIAAEVAHNHQKLKPLEVEATQITELKHYFTKLDFALINSQLVDLNRWQLLGGRYCSIQGITAAQLRMLDNQTGEIQTLYEAAYEPDRHGDIPDLNQEDSPLQVTKKGITANMWIENGLLFVLTGNL